MDKIIREQKYLLYAGLAVFIIICYQLALKPTIDAWQRNTELKELVGQAAAVTGQPRYQLRKKNNLDTIINRFRTDTGVFHNQVLNKIALIAQKQNVKLTDMPKPDQLSAAGPYLIQKLAMEGGYFALLKTLHELRSSGQTGFIRSATLTVPDRDKPAKQPSLVLTVYMEVIR